MTNSGRLSGWRQDPRARMHQDAFLAEIAVNWRPSTRRERLQATHAMAVHLFARLFDGPPSLAPAAAAGVLAALGTALLPAASVPSNPDYTLGPPTWAYLLITAGLIGLSRPPPTRHCGSAFLRSAWASSPSRLLPPAAGSPSSGWRCGSPPPPAP
jgi:hypothetical protein